MLFNSFQFLCFFPIVTFLYFVIPFRFRNFALLVASCIFYMAAIPSYILILAFTIIVDYFAAILIEDFNKNKRMILGASLVANIGVLGVFKYYGFFTAYISVLSHLLGTDISVPALSLILPIGLSFHTFQAMSYTIEVFRGHQRCERNFINYALYVMFYPQLVAGPIERPQNLLPQFKEHHRFEVSNLVEGLRLIFWGLIKKILIADRLAVIVNHVFSNPESTHGLPLLIAIYFFSVQIYCDFSGYSDIARGAARVMGFNLMINFKTPFFAGSLSGFWKRWHISLSTWFKDYLYIPLGGNRVTTARWIFNTLIIFTVSGLWHGANWTFVIWGVLHGLGLVLERGFKSLPLFAGFKWGGILTFHFVAFAFVFFRAASFTEALAVFKGLLQWQDTFTIKQFGTLGVSYFEVFLNVSLVASFFGVEFLIGKKIRWFVIQKMPVFFRWASYYAALALLVLFGKFSQMQFIYFQF